MVQRALDASEKRRSALLKKLQARSSFSERMRTQGMTIDYRPDDDYLAVTFGSPTESVSVPASEGVYLLLDPDSGELNALEVPFFREVFQANRLKGEFWQLIAEWLQSGHTSVHIPPRWEDRAEDAVRNLVSA